MVKLKNRILRCVSASGMLLAVLALSSRVANAQADAGGAAASEPALAAATLTLPAAEQSLATSSTLTNSGASSSTGVFVAAPFESLSEASPTEKYIEPSQTAPPLSAKYKFLLGVKAAFSPFAAVSWFAAADYEQLGNEDPNYGTDRGAFGQRLGAAAIRDASEDVFADSFMSPLFHEDPRYYRLGPSHNFFIRVVHAGFRPVIGRTDGGLSSPNFSNLAGTMAGTALTNAYYPSANRSLTQTMQTFGWSLGVSSVGYVFREFSGDITQMFHPLRMP